MGGHECGALTLQRIVSIRACMARRQLLLTYNTIHAWHADSSYLLSLDVGRSVAYVFCMARMFRLHPEWTGREWIDIVHMHT